MQFHFFFHMGSWRAIEIHDVAVNISFLNLPNFTL